MIVWIQNLLMLFAKIHVKLNRNVFSKSTAIKNPGLYCVLYNSPLLTGQKRLLKMHFCHDFFQYTFSWKVILCIILWTPFPIFKIGVKSLSKQFWRGRKRGFDVIIYMFIKKKKHFTALGVKILYLYAYECWCRRFFLKKKQCRKMHYFK